MFTTNIIEKYTMAGEGNSNLLQYYCLGNPMDKGAWSKRVRHDLATKQQQQQQMLDWPEGSSMVFFFFSCKMALVALSCL